MQATYTQHDTKCTYIQNVVRGSFFRTFDLTKYIKSPSNVYTLNVSRKSLLNCVFCNNYHETKIYFHIVHSVFYCGVRYRKFISENIQLKASLTLSKYIFGFID